jgi:hypothetical protein
MSIHAWQIIIAFAWDDTIFYLFDRSVGSGHLQLLADAMRSTSSSHACANACGRWRPDRIRRFVLIRRDPNQLSALSYSDLLASEEDLNSLSRKMNMSGIRPQKLASAYVASPKICACLIFCPVCLRRRSNPLKVPSIRTRATTNKSSALSMVASCSDQIGITLLAHPQIAQDSVTSMDFYGLKLPCFELPPFAATKYKGVTQSAREPQIKMCAWWKQRSNRGGYVDSQSALNHQWVEKP